MSKSQPSRRKQSRSTPRPKKQRPAAPPRQHTDFTTEEFRVLHELAVGEWPPENARALVRGYLRSVARKVARCLEASDQEQRAKARRREIDENIIAFES